MSDELDTLIEQDIPFSVEENSDDMQQMDVIQDVNGGMCGTGSGVTRWVNPEDENRAADIRNPIFNIQL